MVALRLKLKKSILKRLNLNWFPSILRARILAYNNEFIKALEACHYSDIYVLSKAGLHLQVIEKSRNPSIELALAYASTNQHKKAFAVIDKIGINKRSSVLLGALAIQNPSYVANLLEDKKGFDKVKAFCNSSIGSEIKLKFCKDKITDWHNLALNLKSKNYKASKNIFNNIFIKANLLIPKVEFKDKGLVFSSLCHYKTEVESISKLSSVEQPFISVVMTVFNMEKTVLQALSSLQNQTWCNLEIIVVNDCSTDNTFLLIKEAADNDQRIKIINLDENVGLWRAKNVGVSRASGDYITMHDADDWSHAQKIETQVAPLIKNPKTIATISYMIRVQEEAGNLFTRNAINFVRLNASSLMMRREDFIRAGPFNENLIGSDIEFIVRIKKQNIESQFLNIRLPLSFSLNRKMSLSNQHRKDSQMIKRLKHFEMALCNHH